MRVCSKCGVDVVGLDNRGYSFSYCRECHNKHSREWMRKKHGIRSQCAGCGVDFVRIKSSFCSDACCVKHNYVVEGECHIWKGACPVIGRVKRPVLGGPMRYVYRLVFERDRGVKLETKDYVKHTCGNSTCVNSDHLTLLTIRKNKRVKSCVI